MLPATLTTKEIIDALAQELHRTLSPSQLTQLAKKTGFVQRESKCTAQDFVSLCVLLNGRVATTPLSRLCNHLDAENHLSMSTEGLNLRFNPCAVAFLRSLFSTMLHNKVAGVSKLPCELESAFHRICILDSTVFQIPDSYMDVYQCSGGSAHTAGMKIQLECEVEPTF